MAAIFQTSALAFNILKIVGAGYLLFLSWQAFRESTADIDETDEIELEWRKLYSRGVVMSITNPKVAIFFLAFLPQFADPELGSRTKQMMVFGRIFVAVSFLIFWLNCMVS